MTIQAVFNIAEICARHGITDVILSPGSRSAPLTLAFARHPAYRGKLRVVPDERAAAFIGLGIAQATRRPVVLVCTSGTAGLNYAPAVAEAYFQQIPLLVLTADRPPEWIDQLDGQTIRQRNLYGAHAKGTFDFPTDTEHADAKWHSERIINEAINLTRAAPAGPVQVNIPLREPFYPKSGEEMGYEEGVKIIQEHPASPSVSVETMEALVSELDATAKVLFVFGQQDLAPWHIVVENLAQKQRNKYVFVADVISNFNQQQIETYAIHSLHDLFLSGSTAESKALLQPTLLITCGKSLISKALKQFLRQYPAAQHWHIQPAGEVADTFQFLTRIIRAEPAVFLPTLLTKAGSSSVALAEERQAYCTAWNNASATASKVWMKVLFPELESSPFYEFVALRYITHWLPNDAALHLANSMVVRYANITGLVGGLETNIEVFANRGTSGIDGCASTAVGAALAQPERPVVLLTGDVAFFYDRNAFWHNYPTPNLRVVLFNNHGGGIFRLIDGPRQQPELDEFFETTQALTAENLCRDFGLRYLPVVSFAELEAALPVFFAAEAGAAVLEVFTDSKTNAAFFEEYRAAVKKAFS